MSMNDLKQGAGGGGLGDLLGGGGGGGLGSILGGILGGSGGGGGGGALANPMLRLLLPAVASMLANGGLGKILSGLKANGKGAAADSWVAKGENHPVAADDVREAAGDDEITSIAEKLGVSKDEAAAAIAQVLPHVVDQVTPEGELPAEQELDAKLGKLRELEPQQS